MAKAEISVSVERAIHKALEDMAQGVWDRHKVRINSVCINWFEVVNAEGTRNIVQGCDIESSSFVGSK